MDAKLLLLGALLPLLFLFGCSGGQAPMQETNVSAEPASAAEAQTLETVEAPHTGTDGCVDSDSGFVIHERGEVRVVEGGKETALKQDFCYDNETLYEYFCEGGALGHDSVKCPCSDGVCAPILNYTECIDSDGGNNKAKKGGITLRKHYTDGNIVPEYVFEDTCTDEKELIEYFCDGDKARKYIYTCESCSNGAC